MFLDANNIAKNVRLNTGEAVRFRPLIAEDSELLGKYFVGLSEATRKLYGPHPFNEEAACQICTELGNDRTLRMLAVRQEGGCDRIIGYFIVVLGVREPDRERYQKLGIPLHDESDCTIAPSTADAYQNQGVGTLLMAHVADVLRQMGRARILLWGGTREDNPRAIHFYTKLGFRKVGEFRSHVNNYDMIMDL